MTLPGCHRRIECVFRREDDARSRSSPQDETSLFDWQENRRLQLIWCKITHSMDYINLRCSPICVVSWLRSTQLLQTIFLWWDHDCRRIHWRTRSS